MSIATRKKASKEKASKNKKPRPTIKKPTVRNIPVYYPDNAKDLSNMLSQIEPLTRSSFLISCGTQRRTLNMIDKARGIIIGEKRAFAFGKSIVTKNGVFRGMFVKSIN